MKRDLLLVVAAAALLWGASCQSSATDAVVDELSDEHAGSDADTDKASDAILTIANDYRKCSSPLCGGIFVKRANYAKVRCATAWKKECYVADIDFSGATVPQGYDLLSVRQAVEEGHVLLRGHIAQAPEGTYAAGLNVLYATEVWLSATANQPEGIYVGISPSGIVCITTPCPSLAEQRINSTVNSTIAAIDFTESGATEAQTSQALDAAFTDGLIIVGSRYQVYENGSTSRGRTATQFFTQLEVPCFTTGCSGQLCADTDIVTTCQYDESYACYETAECKRQENGMCGFTPTPELAACLGGAAQE